MPKVVFERALVCNNSVMLSKRGNEYSPLSWLDLDDSSEGVFTAFQFGDEALELVKELIPTYIYRLVFELTNSSERISLKLAEVSPIARLDL